jgi:hypothetical protein
MPGIQKSGHFPLLINFTILPSLSLPFNLTEPPLKAQTVPLREANPLGRKNGEVALGGPAGGPARAHPGTQRLFGLGKVLVAD